MYFLVINTKFRNSHGGSCGKKLVSNKMTNNYLNNIPMEVQIENSPIYYSDCINEFIERNCFVVGTIC